MKHKIDFDIDGALQALREGKDFGGKDPSYPKLVDIFYS